MIDFNDWPIVTADVTFLRTAEGGRRTPPIFCGEPKYSPDIVVQDRNVRQAIVGPGNVGQELYEGVLFIDGPDNFQLGETARVRLVLRVFPRHRYPAVQPGATFTVREGAKIVAHGIVLDRTDPKDP